MYRRFRVQVLVRLVLIVVAAMGLAYLIGWTAFYEGYVLVGAVIVYLVVSLVRYVEKTTRDLSRFLQAIRYADFSQGFVSGQRGPLFDELSSRFDDVVSEFKRIRAEKEEQVRYLQNVIRHIGIALVAFQEDGKVEFANSAAKRLLGTHSIRHVDDFREFSDELVGTVRAMESGQRTLVRVDHDGKVHQLSVYATRFLLREQMHTLVSVQDIGNELEEKEMEAWQQLTRVLTHEIMNSVAPISSLAYTASQLLHDGALGDERSEREMDAREALDVIQRRSDSLIHFVDAYRNFTRIPTPEFELVPVEDLFRRVCRLLGAQSQAVQFSTAIRPPTLQLTADPNLIEQVLINLVLNAIQAVEQQTEARVELSAHVDRRGMPVIEVSDNGPGIPPDVQERIFIPFFTTKEEGSGIGLSLSRQIMRLHGGSISVRSESGAGAVFRLQF